MQNNFKKLKNFHKKKLRKLKLFESPAVGQKFTEKSPGLLGGVLQRARRLPSEEIQVWKEVVRTTFALEARDQLQEDPVDSVADGGLIPLDLPRVFLELVEDDRLDDVVGHRISG